MADICRYCAHVIAEGLTHCLHCGAPAAVEAAVRRERRAHPRTESDRAGPSHTEPVAGLADRLEQRARTGFAAWSARRGWPAALAGIGAVAAAGGLVLWLFGHPAPPLSRGADNPVALLPAQLRQSVVCTLYDKAEPSDACVIHAGDPLLAGRIAGDADLTFYVEQAAPAELARNIARWRTEGGTVVADDPATFVQIGASGDVQYADIRTGLRIDTATFADQQSAQTFLTRSGLLP